MIEDPIDEWWEKRKLTHENPYKVYHPWFSDEDIKITKKMIDELREGMDD